MISDHGSANWVEISLRRARATFSRSFRRVIVRLGQLPGRAAYRHPQFELVEQSGLFEPGWYLRTYPDVEQAGADPLHHYMTHGWHQGRDPGPDFGTTAYLKMNADVARAGANPLLHFIEFGRFEGREAYHPRVHVEPPGLQSFEFGTAADCFSTTLDDDPPKPWRRSYRITARGRDLVKLADWAIGHSTDPIRRESIRTAFELFKLLTGLSDQPIGDVSLPSLPGRMIDAWYVNSSQLRTRWEGTGDSFVVRALQFDPSTKDQLCLVGEGLVCTPLDIVDFHLKNAFFPVLVVFSEPDGELRGSRILAFPSLCRGGLHYAELLTVSNPDALAHSEMLAGRLLRLVGGLACPALAKMVVDIRGATGTEPSFQGDYQVWLSKVARIGVEAAVPEDSSDTARFLAQEVAVGSQRAREEGAIIKLPAAAVPTISALTEIAADGREILHTRVQIVVGSNHARRVISLAFPAAEADGFEFTIGSYWPLDSLGAWTHLLESGPAAIFLPRNRRLTEEELLVPVAGGKPADTVRDRPAITWVIETNDWEPSQLRQAVTALALQEDSNRDFVAFAGRLDGQTLCAANDCFADHVLKFATYKDVVESLTTPLAGFVGSGVILHDRRTARLVSSLLDGRSVVTASCVLISSEERGKAAHFEIADAGTFATDGGRPLGDSEYAFVAEQLWRSTFPVVSPPSNFWIGRSSLLRSWIGGEVEAQDGLHAVTFRVTASCFGFRNRSRSGDHMPTPASNRAMKVEMLVG